MKTKLGHAALRAIRHIPDEPILDFLAGRSMPALYYVGAPDHPSEDNLAWALPKNTPPHIVLLKMQDLINRGLVDGCACGCRGDFELPFTPEPATVAAAQAQGSDRVEAMYRWLICRT